MEQIRSSGVGDAKLGGRSLGKLVRQGCHVLPPQNKHAFVCRDPCQNDYLHAEACASTEGLGAAFRSAARDFGLRSAIVELPICQNKPTRFEFKH